MNQRIVHLALLIVLLNCPQASWAWSPCIQGVIGLAAVEGLSDEERIELLNLLRHHPQYEEMIAPPEGSDPEHWDELIIIRAGTWADRVAGTKYDRPKWHFFPGVSATMGEVPPESLPKPPTTLPSGELAEPAELNLVQAIKLCLRMLKDESAPEADRAMAACWLMNLSGDLHQPLHMGSLYAVPTFASGDDHGRKLLIGDKTLYDIVENFPNRGDELADILDLKKDFEQDFYWESEMKLGEESGLPFEDLLDIKVEVMADRASWLLYDEYAKEIESACDAGTPAPLSLPDRPPPQPLGFFGALLLAPLGISDRSPTSGLDFLGPSLLAESALTAQAALKEGL